MCDAGALIAIERRSRRMNEILWRALSGTIDVVVPRTVVAQVWRGTPSQANVNRLLKIARTAPGSVVIDELTEERAKQIGVVIGQTSHPDIVDIHVALAAADRGYAVLTSDDADTAKVDESLELVHV